jgi:hypothetical protein
MKRKTAIFLATIAIVSFLAKSHMIYASSDFLTSSTTVYGAYNVQHDLELWVNTGSGYYKWWAECDHYAWNINTFGQYCYCNCTTESLGVIINQSGRAYAVYVDSKWHSHTSMVPDTSLLGMGHAYCGTEPH